MNRKFLPILTAAIAASSSAAHAVVVALDNSDTYTQAPTPANNDFGFGNVAIVSNFIAGIPASGIYVGNGWILTAYHNFSDNNNGFQVGSISLGGVPYTADASTVRRLHNPTGLGLSVFTDLAMVRLTTIPSGVSSIPLSGVAPSIGANVRMMGNGVDRGLTEKHWDSSLQEVGSTSTYNGYDIVGTRAMRWGTNTVTDGLFNVNAGYGNFLGYYTTFNATSGDAQATSGDSGGGVFRKNGNTWELTGIILAADQHPPAPGPSGTVLYGDRTFAADISTYRNEIESIRAIPEPSAAIFSLTGLAVALQRRRRASAR